MSAWPLTTLGDVATLRIGRTPPRGDARYWTSDLTRPFCTIADMRELSVTPRREGVTELAEREGKAKRFPAGSLLMSFKLTIGRVGFAAVDLFPNEAIVGIEVQDAFAIDPRFLALALQVQDFSAVAGRAVKGNTLTRGAIESLPVPIPPMSTQRRIVHLVGALDGNIGALDDEAAASSALTASLRTTLLDGAQGERVSLAEVSSFASGYSFDPKHQGSVQGEYPFLKVSDMNLRGNEERIVAAQNWVGAAQLSALKARTWPAGTVIFPKVGAALLTEKRRLLTRESAFDNNIMGLVPGPRISPEYLFAVMSEVRLGEFAQSGPVPSINQGHIRDINITLPDLLDQRAVTDTLAAAATTHRRLEDEVEALRASRASLVAQLLSGDLEIPESYDDVMRELTEVAA